MEEYTADTSRGKTGLAHYKAAVLWMLVIAALESLDY